MSTPTPAPSKSKQLADKARHAKLAMIYKWPCDGVARCAISGSSKIGLVTYSVAYNIIFHEAGGILEGEKRIHTRETVRRLKLLNAFYLAKAGGWVKKQIRHTLGVAMLVNAMKQKPEPDPENEKQTQPQAGGESDKNRAAAN
jgi:hypothetical protein